MRKRRMSTPQSTRHIETVIFGNIYGNASSIAQNTVQKQQKFAIKQKKNLSALNMKTL